MVKTGRNLCRISTSSSQCDLTTASGCDVDFVLAVAYIVGMPIGEFEVLILMAVLRLDGEAYAPAIRAEIERRTGRTVSRGATYVTLNRLDAKGLIQSHTSDEADSGGRPRRYYRIRPKGLNAIRRTLAALEEMRHGVPVLSRA